MRGTRYVAGAIGALLLSCSGACIFADCGTILFVKGRVVDAATMAPISGALMGGRSFTDNQETGHIPPIIFDGSPSLPPTSADGSFQFDFSDLVPCGKGYSFPRPDEIEVIVVRDGCEQSFTIAINPDMVVDITFPNDTIELKDPILVPPCP